MLARHICICLSTSIYRFSSVLQSNPMGYVLKGSGGVSTYQTFYPNTHLYHLLQKAFPNHSNQNYLPCPLCSHSIIIFQLLYLLICLCSFYGHVCFAHWVIYYFEIQILIHPCVLYNKPSTMLSRKLSA